VKLADHFGKKLAQIARENHRIFVLDGDLADSDGAEQFAKEEPHKFLMGGIAEQNLVSMAAGMASCGMRPFVFSFAAFLTCRSCDQIRLCLSQANQPVTLVGSHAGGLTGRNGKSHAALNDTELISSLQNIQIWEPADVKDVEYCITKILANNLPAYVRLPRKDFDNHSALPGEPKRQRWLQPFNQVNVVSSGLGTLWATEAMNKRPEKVGLLHCLSLDFSDKIIAHLSRSSAIICIEDHHMFGGLWRILQSRLPHIPIISIGWPSEFQGKHGDEQKLRRENGLSPDQIGSLISKEYHAQILNRSCVETLVF
jgi:transketolase